MLKVIAFGLAAGAAVQAFRAFPPAAVIAPESVALLFIVGLVAAYLGGRWHGRGRYNVSATATATAAAQAHNSVQLAVIVPGQGAASASGVPGVPTSAAPWLDHHTATRQITADDLEGMDLSEFTEVLDHQDTTAP